MKQLGFSTLEALGALMVLNLLGVGLLQWQWQAMQAQREALAFQNAAGLAQDLWQRMQVNTTGASHYQLTYKQATTGPDCAAQACSPAQWAQADLADWLQELQLRMPGAQAQLATISAPKALVSLSLAWPTALPTSTTSHPPCPEHHRCWHTTWPL